MNSSSLEIREDEYCIKLSKTTFDLSLVRQLIKRIQAEEKYFINRTSLEDDVVSRTIQEEEIDFDHLDDK